MNRLLFVSLVLLALSQRTLAESCWFEGYEGQSTIQITTVPENTPGETIFARFQLVNAVSTATVANPFNKYIYAVRYASGVYDLVTTAIFPDFVTTERVTEIQRTIVITCADTTTSRVTFVVPVPDANNQPPVFNQASYDISYAMQHSPSGDHTLVQTGIVVTDLDVNFAHANVYITSTSRYFLASVTPLFTATEFGYQVDFLADNTISAGSYSTMLAADDGAHVATAMVRITVLPPPTTTEPEPTEEPTTPTPVTEGPEVTTTTTTTEEPIPTTAEPEGPTCGLTGLDPGNPVTLAEPLDPLLPFNTEIWRHPTYNVVSSLGVSHPHNKYLSAFRAGGNYWFTTTDSYPNFSLEQGTNVLQRIVNFNCDDGSVVQYHFQFAIGIVEEDTCGNGKCSPIESEEVLP